MANANPKAVKATFDWADPLRLDGAEVELEAGGHGILLDARLYGHQGAQV